MVRMEKPDPKTISSSPGVYCFTDEKGIVIYAGKAKSLRKRILSYFRPGHALPAKTRAMLVHARSLQTFVTSTEKEALLLEASVIKKHRPRYNIVLRDDKDYILFRLDTNAPFPRLEIVRRVRPGRSRAGNRTSLVLFGPFSSAGAARETWRAIHRLFPLRRCSDRACANRSRTCLYHHMGQCLGPCSLDVDKEAYAAMVRQVLLFLQGKSKELLTLLRGDMQAASDALDFERAAVLRDRIQAVSRTVEQQAVVLDVNQDMDVLGIAAVDGGLALCILFVRGGILLDKRVYFWPDLGLDDIAELLEKFLAQLYQTGLPVPPKIIAPWLRAADIAGGVPPASGAGPFDTAQNGAQDASDGSPDEALSSALAELRGGAVHLALPKGRAEESLVSLAAANAAELRRQPDRVPMAQLLAAALHAPGPVERIEAVDVSHTGGRETRVGMVVFVDEHPERSGFRSYAVDADGDDYAALYQWAARRADSGAPWPDLVLVDGGRGQVASVARAFEEAGVTAAFTLAGIAKARTEDGRADRRAGNDADRIFLHGRANPLPIPPGSPELFFLQHLRDTAHDFAGGRHRKARAGRAMAGELLRVPGVGPKIARILWRHFGSLEAMADADEAAFAAIPGIGPGRAQRLAAHCKSLKK